MIPLRSGCLATIIALVPVQAVACEADESFLFACKTTSPERTISLCGRQEDSGEGMRWLSLRFVDEENGKETLSWPADPVQGFKQFYFSHFFNKGNYEAYLRFKVGEDGYRIFFRDSIGSGVEISRPGKALETLTCAEEPNWYFDQTRFLTACDLENPLGTKACEHDPPVLK